MAIYLSRVLCGESLGEICENYHLKKHRSAGSVMERAKGQLLKDRKFKKRVDKLSRSISKKGSKKGSNLRLTVAGYFDIDTSCPGH